MNYYPNLNDIFISERLKRRLSEIDAHPITTVIAPMGFGKTTAMGWWSKRQVKKQKGTVILRQMIVTDSLTDFWRGFCRILKKYPVLAEQMKELGYPKDARSIALMAEILEDELSDSDKRFYFILDDLYILKEKPLIPLLLFLCRRLPDSIHIILLSRNQVFGEEERMHFGNLLCEITADDLRLSKDELAVYAKYCGLKISTNEINELATLSEGWISMVYLNFKFYAQKEQWLSNTADIFTLMDKVLLEPLPERQREFLILIGITNEFTKEQASYLWQHSDAIELLEDLSKNNAFITRGESGIYRYHHMLQQCTGQRFSQKSKAYQRENLSRLGQWHIEGGDYIPAYYAFATAKDWDRLLITMEMDKLKSLNNEHSQDFFRWLKECSEETFLKHPAAITPCMVKCFSFHNIPELIRLKSLLLKALEVDTVLTEKERNNLLGDAEISESFLKYNNISAMSEHHRRACALLNRTSLSVDQKGSWTFSAPSIFMMYHRGVGNADVENAEMKECMPYYYQVSDGHGNGAEHGFAADMYYERGQFINADIENQMARSAANRKNQYSIIINCDFLSMRMALFNGDYEGVKNISTHCQEWLRKERQYTLLNTLDMCRSFIYALLGHTEAAPAWLRAGRLSESLLMFPAMPMLHTFYNQLLLADKQWTTVVARREECERIYGVYHNIMCEIWLHIQLSAALEQLKRHEEAEQELYEALNKALPDGIIMPFVESENYLEAPFKRLQDKGLYPKKIDNILSLSEKFHKGKQKILWEHWSEHENYGLTQKELEIAKLAAQRKTNTEIANELHLAVGTVRNQLSRIFEKLNITGNIKNKRLELETLLKIQK